MTTNKRTSAWSSSIGDFRFQVPPLPDSLEQEVAIVAKRVGEMSESLELPAPNSPHDAEPPFDDDL
jgi:hypothetical protein